MAPLTAIMECPNCRRVTSPDDDASTAVIAWYTCEHCNHHWSARLRNGIPDVPAAIPLRPVPTTPGADFTGLVCPMCEQPVARVVQADTHSIACECPHGFCWTTHASPRAVGSTNHDERVVAVKNK